MWKIGFLSLALGVAGCVPFMEVPRPQPIYIEVPKYIQVPQPTPQHVPVPQQVQAPPPEPRRRTKVTTTIQTFKNGKLINTDQKVEYRYQ